MQKKIHNYLATRDELLGRYSAAKARVLDLLQVYATSLYEFDQLCYSYYALKSYYDLSKTRWDSDYRNLLDELALLNTRLEDKIPIADLYTLLPELAVVRRLLKENAKEGGKVAHLMVASSADLGALKLQLKSGSDKSAAAVLVAGAGYPEATAARPSTTEAEHGRTDLVRPKIVAQPGANQPAVQSTGLKQKSVKEATATGSKPAAIVTRDNSARDASSLVEVVQASTPPQAITAALGAPKASKEPETSSFNGHITSNTASKISKTTAFPTTAATAATPAQTAPLASSSGPATVPGTAEVPTNTPTAAAITQPSIVNSTPTAPAASNEQALKPKLAPTVNDVFKEGPRKELSPAPATKRREPSPGTPDSKRSKREDRSFDAFPSWTREHVKSFTVAAAKDPQRPIIAIQEALRKNFDVIILPDAANTLRLHYGMVPSTIGKYRYYNQAFNLVAQSFYENRQKYVTVPWADLRLHFARKAMVNIQDWEIKGRYALFLLHRRTYGPQGEPTSNYVDLVEDFQRSMIINRVELPTQLHNLATPVPQSPLTFSKESPVVSLDTADRWTPELINHLIDAEVKIPLDSTRRTAVIMHYIRLKTGHTFTQQEIEERRKWKDVEIAVEYKREVIRRQQESQAPPKASPLAATESRQQTPVANKIVASSVGSTSEPVLQGSQLSPVQSSANAAPAATTAKQAILAQNEASPASHAASEATPSTPIVALAEQNELATPSASNSTTKKKSNHFDKLLEILKVERHPEWHYQKILQNAELSPFWTLERCRTIVSTIEYMSQFPQDTNDITIKVARLNMVKVMMLRFLREHQLKIDASLIEARIMRMMQLDVFDEPLCRLINDYFRNK